MKVKAAQKFVDSLYAGKWRPGCAFTDYHWRSRHDTPQRLIAFGLVVGGVQTVEPTIGGTASDIHSASLIAHGYVECQCRDWPGHHRQLLGELLSASGFKWSGAAGDTYMQACAHTKHDADHALRVCAWFTIFKRVYDRGAISVREGQYSAEHMIASSDLQLYWPWPVTDLRPEWARTMSSEGETCE